LALAVDQAHAQLLFERLDAAAQGRLGEKERVGRLAEGLCSAMAMRWRR
jgi:hypothetical protein